MRPYQAVQFAAAIYDPIAPGVFEKVIRIGDWVVGVAHTSAGKPIITIAGTECIRNFLTDADFLLIDAGQLGKVHAGFYKHALAVYEALGPYLADGMIIIGHSLGAARAAILAALCAIHSMPVAQLFLFEPPRAGQEELTLLVRGFVTEIVATKNGRDLVPHVPPYFPLLYVDIVPLTELDSPADSLDPIDDHLLPAVTAGVLKHWPPSNNCADVCTT